MTDQPQPTELSREVRARNAAAELCVELESTALGRVWSRLLEVEFVNRSVALVAMAFQRGRQTRAEPEWTVPLIG